MLKGLTFEHHSQSYRSILLQLERELFCELFTKQNFRQ